MIFGQEKGMPNFSGFNCMEELHIWKYQLLAETSLEALKKLAIPYPRHLSISFGNRRPVFEGLQRICNGKSSLVYRLCLHQDTTVPRKQAPNGPYTLRSRGQRSMVFGFRPWGLALGLPRSDVPGIS